MGARKRNVAEQRKATMKNVAVAKLNDCPTSPRKMRLVADMIRGKRVDMALAMLRLSTKEAAGRLENFFFLRWQTGSRKMKEVVLKMQS